ncbi:sensor histidine kinase [Acetivibrio mesophilus]|uniref:histidine kinase n=1 Tax=Acetivibrio mesophilus TaxID=2487273 RepID=A0A4Q0I3T8_9FIRM|nr:ATP-binding protein [Acetivibrio mesophilus]ODM25350.1 histidine kinase [Clostridium sp. Bc-iso-3]RXE58427.1 sensor histidine kinase [Acetivibrio mesophilus]HHV28653.1 sensor histidine kinase [Clostridium sp.]
MFRKLKIKFILTNIVSLTTVLLIIFFGIYLSMKGFLKFQADIILYSIANEEKLNSNFDSGLVRFFFIKINTSEEIVGYLMNINISNEDMKAFKEKVIERDVTHGKIANDKFKFKFLKIPKEYGHIIVFLDYSVEEKMYKPLIVISIYIVLLSIVLVFTTSLFLANRAIKPIKISWEKQTVFIADASHELRTPLAVVNSNLEIVMENENETIGSQKKWLDNIQNELDRMKKLIDDLLFLARADSEDEMPKEYFDLSKLLHKVFNNFILLCEKKGLKLRLDTKDNIIFYGNEFRIKQLLSILLDNSIKYTGSGGEIELKLKSDVSTVQLSVRDTGEGIPKEHIDKIFDRFHRVDKSRSRNHGGAGLGLAIAKCIVNEHKGTIKVISEVSKGTEFTISLPQKVSSKDFPYSS